MSYVQRAMIQDNYLNTTIEGHVLVDELDRPITPYGQRYTYAGNVRRNGEWYTAYDSPGSAFKTIYVRNS